MRAVIRIRTNKCIFATVAFAFVHCALVAESEALVGTAGGAVDWKSDCVFVVKIGLHLAELEGGGAEFAGAVKLAFGRERC